MTDARFLPTEAFAISQALMPKERAEAKKRQGRPGKACSGKFPEHKSQTRDRAARSLGLSGWIEYQTGRRVFLRSVGLWGPRMNPPVARPFLPSAASLLSRLRTGWSGRAR